MIYRLSNTAERLELEKVFNVPMAYPAIYNPEVVIDGLKESTISIRTSTNPEVLSPAIWGLLPHGYTEQWRTFQNIRNTLNFNTEEIKTNLCFRESLYKRRCIIFVTGFFTTYVKNGGTYAFYVHSNDDKPLCLAGIFNELDDGFLTCSILLSKASKSLRYVQNICEDEPIIFNTVEANAWLDCNILNDKVDEIIDNPPKAVLKSYPISSNFYTDDVFDSNILKPFIFEPHIVIHNH